MTYTIDDLVRVDSHLHKDPEQGKMSDYFIFVIHAMRLKMLSKCKLVLQKTESLVAAKKLKLMPYKETKEIKSRTGATSRREIDVYYTDPPSVRKEKKSLPKNGTVVDLIKKLTTPRTTKSTTAKPTRVTKKLLTQTAEEIVMSEDGKAIVVWEVVRSKFIKIERCFKNFFSIMLDLMMCELRGKAPAYERIEESDLRYTMLIKKISLLPVDLNPFQDIVLDESIEEMRLFADYRNTIIGDFEKSKILFLGYVETEFNNHSGWSRPEKELYSAMFVRFSTIVATYAVVGKCFNDKFPINFLTLCTELARLNMIYQCINCDFIVTILPTINESVTAANTKKRTTQQTTTTVTVPQVIDPRDVDPETTEDFDVNDIDISNSDI